MPSPRVAPKRSHAVRETIEERIVDGTYGPGTRLDEAALAKEFGVSRTPIRETLIQLSSSGMIDLRPRRGAVVAEMSPHRLCEMFEVMAELEAMCGRLAARRMTEDEHRRLTVIHERCEAARDAGGLNDYFAHNEEFHRLIHAASHNSFLMEQAVLLQRRLRPYRRLQLRMRNRLKNSYSEHQGIVDALIAGDGELAAERLRSHVIVQGQRYGDLVASLAMMHEGPAAKGPARDRGRAAKRVRS
jgi:DNA-binding GntR family transcriptional regulator